ncbi:MAG: AAA family ATPase [Verrucomicrobia bacterium]|nr:AAA family ATPase [Verrucomicrobiota bacterium]
MSDYLDSSAIPPELRAALRHSPDNTPLLVHVADTVLKAGAFTEAAAMFKRALALDPANIGARLGLATAFFQQGKHSAALVMVEDMVKQPDAPARAWLLNSHLALHAGEPRLAARHYLKAREADPLLVDAALEQDLAPHLPARPSPRPPAPASPPPPADDDINPYAAESSPESGRERLPSGDLPPEASPAMEPERPELTFADVGGMDRVKEEVRMKIILPLRQPELFKAYGKKVGGGILMYGPPGCGKTFLARATAGEVKAGFLAVGISDVLDMWIGQSEKNLHGLFEQARSHRPCVLFFDEVDALGANRTDMLKSGGRQIINQFLSELDGVTTSNEGVLILAATNAPWHLDPAFRRPGRFDRILFVPPPDTAARAAIFRLLLKGKPVAEIDFDALAKKTDGYSGADLKAVIDVAVEEKLREAMKAGAVQPLTGRDLLEAVKRQKPTVRDWFETARNHALYANQSGLYDDILAYLNIKK